jgi:hypothetical protein
MLSQTFEEALVFTFQLHQRQTRKGSGAPYFSHLMGVASVVLEYGGSEAQAIAGLLHDAVEDQSHRLGGFAAAGQAIADRFGAEIATMVLACTDAQTLPKPPWRERKQRYIGHVAEMDVGAALVSCCDKLHNARSLVADFRLVGDALFRRFSASRAETLWYYAELAQAFNRHHPGRVANELARTVKQLEELVRAADQARASSDPLAPPYEYDHVVLGRRGKGSVNWVYVDNAGNLVVELYRHGDPFGDDSHGDAAYLLKFDPAAQLALARALGEPAPDSSSPDPQHLIGLIAARFDGSRAVEEFVQCNRLPHRQEDDYQA